LFQPQLAGHPAEGPMPNDTRKGAPTSLQTGDPLAVTEFCEKCPFQPAAGRADGVRDALKRGDSGAGGAPWGVGERRRPPPPCCLPCRERLAQTRGVWVRY